MKDLVVNPLHVKRPFIRYDDTTRVEHRALTCFVARQI